MFGDQLFFHANDGVHGRELWRTDGSAEGTMLVADIAPGIDLTGSQIPLVVTRTKAGPVEVCFHGVPGRQYRIQRSEELATWTDLETVTASPDGKLFLLDLAPPEGRAFYRVALPAP